MSGSGAIYPFRRLRSVPFYCKACSREYVSRWSHVRSAKHKRALAQITMAWA